MTQANLDKLKSRINKEFLTENIHNIYDELIINNSENNEHVVNLFLKKMSKDNRFDKVDDESKKAVIETGLSCLSDVLKTFDLKQKKDILQKENKKLEDLFLVNYEEKILSLKEEIKKNKEEFLALENNADNMSLGQMANSINEFHNPNTTTEVCDQEINDLLNGGNLEF